MVVTDDVSDGESDAVTLAVLDGPLSVVLMEDDSERACPDTDAVSDKERDFVSCREKDMYPVELAFQVTESDCGAEMVTTERLRLDVPDADDVRDSDNDIVLLLDVDSETDVVIVWLHAADTDMLCVEDIARAETETVEVVVGVADVEGECDADKDGEVVRVPPERVFEGVCVSVGLTDRVVVGVSDRGFEAVTDLDRAWLFVTMDAVTVGDRVFVRVRDLLAGVVTDEEGLNDKNVTETIWDGVANDSDFVVDDDRERDAVGEGCSEVDADADEVVVRDNDRCVDTDTLRDALSVAPGEKVAADKVDSLDHVRCDDVGDSDKVADTSIVPLLVDTVPLCEDVLVA